MPTLKRQVPKTRKCVLCRITKPLSEFSDKRAKCRTCRNALNRAYNREQKRLGRSVERMSFDVLCDRMMASVLADCAAGLSLLERSRRDGLVA